MFVGWSLGGHAVLEAASALPMAAGLMIFGTPPIGKGPEGFAGFKGLSNVAFTPAPSEAEIDDWLVHAFAPNFKPIPPFFEADFRKTDGAARGCLGASAQAGMFQDETAIVRDLEIPLAIVQGAEEQIVDLGYLQRLTRADAVARQGAGDRGFGPHAAMGAARGVRKTAGCVRVEPLTATIAACADGRALARFPGQMAGTNPAVRPIVWRWL